MDDHCVECRLYGSNYSYDEDGDIVSNCYDCPFEPYARGEEDDDTISRRAAIDAFAPYAEYESNRTNAEWVRRINMVLSTLPSAQPGWIPCSERCPEQSGWYLVSLKNGNVQKAWYRVAPINQGGSYWRSPIKRPLAWMPLPKPWEGGQHGTD